MHARSSLWTSALCTLLSFSSLFAQAPAKKNASLEQIINQFIGPYSLSTDNQFKIAAYAELKGRFSNSSQSLTLNFGKLGLMTFYEKNCLFRTTQNGIYHLNRYEIQTQTTEAINLRLDEMFENIILLGNHGADSDHIAFVDKALARKNLEPFDKIFLRHILVKHGTYDPVFQEVVFNTESLPDQHFTFQKPGEKGLTKKPMEPLSIKLTDTHLRGFYLNAGGTVFVENVDRPVFFATGEVYDHNITAFKVFLQKLFVQTVQYIVQNEAERLQQREEQSVVTQMITYESPLEKPEAFVAGAKRKRYIAQASKGIGSARVQTRSQVAPLYHEKSWIPMMLAIMRAHKINIGDEEVIRYFVDQVYFEDIYQQLTNEEKSKVRAFQEKRDL